MRLSKRLSTRLPTVKMGTIEGTARLKNCDQDKQGSVLGQMQVEVSLKTYVVTKKLHT